MAKDRRRRSGREGRRGSSGWREWVRSHEVAAFAVVSVAWVLVFYWGALRAPFVYDDLDQIVRNGSLGSWHATFARFCMAPVVFTNGFGGVGGSTYRPVYWLSLTLDRRVWGVDGVAGFHLTNLALYWADGLLLFVLLRRLAVARWVAGVAVLLWLGLPIHSEAVVWVSGRAYLLCGLFLVLGLLAAERYLRSGRWVWLLAGFGCGMGAVLSHEEGLLLLPLAVLVAYAMGRLTWRASAEVVGATAAAAAVYGLLRYLVGARGGSGPAAPWAVGLTFWRYVQWMLVPVRMSVERSTSAPGSRVTAAAMLAWLGLLAVCGAVWLLRRRAPVVAAGLLVGLVALLPFCGVVFVYQGMAERFVYVASAGLALAIAAFALAPAMPWRRVGVGLVVLWAVWGVWRLRLRIADWQDPVVLYRSSLQATPRSATLHYNLGYSLRVRGDLAGAAAEYREATVLMPSYQHAFASLGEVEFGLGRTAEAVTAYERAVALMPTDGDTRINFAVALERTGDRVGAEREFRLAIALMPGKAAAYTDLGVMLFREGRVDDAIQAFQGAMKAAPSDSTAYFDLAVLFQESGRDELALPFYKKVLELKPGDADTISNVSRLRLGR